MAKKHETIKISHNAQCFNCQFSPILARFGNNPVIAYCDKDGNHEPQVAKRHCCKHWAQEAGIKQIEQR